MFQVKLSLILEVERFIHIQHWRIHMLSGP